MALIVSVILTIAVVNYVNKLPPIAELLDDRKRGSVTLLDQHNTVFAWRGNQFGGILKSKSLNRVLHDAIISVEDRTFYSHFGLSVRGILGAIRINLREGRGEIATLPSPVSRAPDDDSPILPDTTRMSRGGPGEPGAGGRDDAMKSDESFPNYGFGTLT